MPPRAESSAPVTNLFDGKHANEKYNKLPVKVNSIVDFAQVWAPDGVSKDASSKVWSAMQQDSRSLSRASLKNSVNAMLEMEKSFPGSIDLYRRLVGNFDEDKSRTYALEPSKTDNPARVDIGKILSNDRAELTIMEASAQNQLDSGLVVNTGLIIGDIRIDPKEKVDLTGNASRSLFNAAKMCDVIEDNLKLAQQQQNNGGNASFDHKIDQNDFHQMADEKKDILSRLHEILRDTPGAQSHDINQLVEGKSSLWQSMLHPQSYTLSQFYNLNPYAYRRMITALDQKAALYASSWSTLQEPGAEGELARKLTAKLFRDAAVMRLSSHPTWANTAHGHAANYDNSRHSLSTDIAIASKLDPTNPDLKAIKAERNKILPGPL